MTTELRPVAPAYIGSLKPYQAGKPIEETAREYGLPEASIIKLASNENPLGMPPAARAAIDAILQGGARYPDPNGHALKTALAQRYKIEKNWITLGNGSSDILELVARAFLQAAQPEQDCNAVSSQYAFMAWQNAVKATGARMIQVPAKDYGHDLDAMAKAVTPATRVVYLANPNNPTGTFFSLEQLSAFLERIPGDVVVLLDEAYNEYLEPQLRYDSTELVRRYPNLVVSRTFSKAFGLAGLRVGFALATPYVTDLLNRVRQTFNVNSLAQAAAIAALSDDDYLNESYRLNREGIVQFYALCKELGLTYVESQGNFVIIKVGNSAELFDALLRRGIIVRKVVDYGLGEWLRVTVGLPEENARFFAALRELVTVSA
ncbi:histidinol-phosphate transaminase [Paraburkholderia bonniea]|uniref:histidinol-phosphate transaminase n=1 Tax=Paraburkholderia bonniea TaxID=2152891 RepID=UPI002572AACF|nr:histidinol-phosphate transaminase [Paraburkholderia bonniea]WJF91927.1 histidinol-phosphate transaminase [Paraburkholderia bonniea]WJF95246.1 histidinol-phosphate transaminase [Paraburkholderia bonniea]